MAQEKSGSGNLTGGSLEKTPLIEVFKTVYQERDSARVIVAQLGEERTFLFDRGQIVSASSNREAQLVGDLLRKFGLANEKVLFAAFEKALSEPGRGLAKVLKETGAVPPFIADACVRALAERILYDSFKAGSGNYTITTLEAIEEPPVRFEQSNASLFMEALRRLPAEQSAGLAKPDPKARPILNEDLLLRYQCVQLSQDEWDALVRIDGVRTASEVCRDLSILARFKAVGIIQIMSAATSKKQGALSPDPRKLNAEIIGAPPLSASDVEAHLGVATKTYRRIDWINLYDFLGIQKNATAEEVFEALQDRAQMFHPDHVTKHAFREERDMMEVLFRRVKQAARVFKNDASRASYDTAQEAGAQSVTLQASGPAREVQLDIAKRNYNRARELFEFGDYYPAYEMVRQAVEFDPDRAEYWVLLSRVQRKNPKWVRQSSETMRRAIAKIPSNVDLLYELSECYGAERNQSERERTLREILKIDPGNRRAQAALADAASGKPGR